MKWLAGAFLVLCCVCGCMPESKGVFQIEVSNVGNTPVSAGLTKDAGGARPELEEGWAAPEDISMFAPPSMGERHWGHLVNPGETRVIGPVEGRFPKGVYAVFRVYAGNRTIDELLAVSRKDPDRAEVYLPNGSSSFTVDARGGRVTITPKQ